MIPESEIELIRMKMIENYENAHRQQINEMKNEIEKYHLTHIQFANEIQSNKLEMENNEKKNTLIPLAISIALRPRILFQLRSIDSNESLPPNKYIRLKLFKRISY